MRAVPPLRSAGNNRSVNHAWYTEITAKDFDLCEQGICQLFFEQRMEMLPVTRGLCAFFSAFLTCLFPRRRTRHQRTFQFAEKSALLRNHHPGERKARLTSKSKGTPRPRLVLLAVQPDACTTEGKNPPTHPDGVAKSTSAKARCNTIRCVGWNRGRIWQITGSAIDRIRAARVVVTLSHTGRAPPCNEFFFLALPMLAVKSVANYSICTVRTLDTLVLSHKHERYSADIHPPTATRISSSQTQRTASRSISLL